MFAWSSWTQPGRKETHLMNKEDRIRRRAYEIWEREGRPHGRDWDHWVKAAGEIDKEGTAPEAANGAGSPVRKRSGGRRSSPAMPGETILPPAVAAKPKRPRAKRTAKT
jgi:hypothetical protein